MLLLHQILQAYVPTDKFV